MSKTAWAIVAATALTTSSAAIAADIARKPYVKAPPVAVYDWTGFYAGVHYGTVISQTKTRTDDPTGFLGTTGREADVNKRGFTVGGQLGYNWQVAPNWLIGVEADLSYLDNDRTNSNWFDNIFIGSKASAMGTARLRTGYVAGPSLIYVTGGYAGVRVTDSYGGFAGSPALAAFAAPARFRDTLDGYAVGAGIETKLSQNWSTRTEYLYVNAGKTSFATTAFPAAIPFTATFDHSYHVIRGGLNYRFGGPFEGLPFFDAALITPSRDWSGFYLGGNIGIGISTTEIKARPGLDPINDPTGRDDINGRGFAGGAQAGYNLMLGPKWFVGVEGDIGALHLRRNYRNWDDPYQATQDTDGYATLRGRIGRSTGAALLYVTGGAAAVDVTTGFRNVAPFAGVVVPSGRVSEVAYGWTIGSGIEVALDPRWSFKAEGLYIDVGNQTSATTNGAGTIVRAVEFDRRFSVFRMGLNYRFGG